MSEAEADSSELVQKKLRETTENNKPKRVRSTLDQLEQLFAYFDAHQEDFRCAKHGYLRKLINGFAAETGRKFTEVQMRRWLTRYRDANNIKIEYVKSNYQPHPSSLSRHAKPIETLTQSSFIHHASASQ